MCVLRIINLSGLNHTNTQYSNTRRYQSGAGSAGEENIRGTSINALIQSSNESMKTKTKTKQNYKKKGTTTQSIAHARKI